MLPQDTTVPICGVYAIENTLNGRVYIGSSINVEKRRKRHFWELERERHFCSHLQRAYLLHGPTAFRFYVVAETTADQLLTLEGATIQTYPPERLYNTCMTPARRMLGVVRSAETRARQSASLKGRRITPEARAKMRAAKLGKTLSVEARAKVSAALRARVYTDTMRANMGAVHRGARHSDEARARMSAARKGVPLGPCAEETREKIRAAKLGQRHTEDAIAKMRAARTGVLPSPETRAKMAASQRAAWARRKAKQED